MKQHDLDPWSLVFGVAFLFISGSYLLTHTTNVRLHWLLVLPAALIVIGFGVLGASVRRMQRSEIDVDDDRRVV
ncbi:MAG TPA: hypothetical protein VHV76_05595 [Mycobacteriales bacterium]|jgi:hypothetical protein|nr:hypothetical protein [Mycobacteriales bacterium]